MSEKWLHRWGTFNTGKTFPRRARRMRMALSEPVGDNAVEEPPGLNVTKRRAHLIPGSERQLIGRANSARERDALAIADRVTLITGASAGIGAELARIFAS